MASDRHIGPCRRMTNHSAGIDVMFSVDQGATTLADYLTANVHYAIGVRFPGDPLRHPARSRRGAHHVLGRSRLWLDAQAPAFLRGIPVNAADRESIAHGNAENMWGCSPDRARRNPGRAMTPSQESGFPSPQSQLCWPSLAMEVAMAPVEAVYRSRIHIPAP